MRVVLNDGNWGERESHAMMYRFLWICLDFFLCAKSGDYIDDFLSVNLTLDVTCEAYLPIVKH